MSLLRVVIHGRVQGVGYRAWTAAAARGYKIHGWVRNRNDGTVEAVFKGEDEAIKSMIEQCKLGPTAARVDKIETFAHKEEIAPGFISRETV